MALITIKSENPAFSFVIHKNPATQRESGTPFAKSFRKGAIRGWFGADDRSFSVHFQDADNECSFATGRAASFEYLDQTRYASPYAPVAMIDTLLRSAVRECHPEDALGYENVLEIAALRITHRGAAQAMVRHFDAFNIELEPQEGKIFRVRIAARRPLYEVLNLTMVFCLLQAIADRDIYIDLTRDALAKYVRSLNAVSAPYFVRYLFNRDAVTQFDDFRALLPELQLEGTTMNHGDTRKHRFHAIKPHFPGGRVMVDIGCGEGFYVKGLADKYGSVIAYEQDEGLRTKTQRFLAAKGVRNADWRAAFTEDERIPEGAHVLMTEVLEHMPQTQSARLLRHLAQQPAARMVFTVPNSEFNTHYGLAEGDFRHSDHDWEPTEAEFKQFMQEGLPGWSLAFEGVGDSVAGVSSSLMCVAQR